MPLPRAGTAAPDLDGEFASGVWGLGWGSAYWVVLLGFYGYVTLDAKRPNVQGRDTVCVEPCICLVQ